VTYLRLRFSATAKEASHCCNTLTADYQSPSGAGGERLRQNRFSKGDGCGEPTGHAMGSGMSDASMTGALQGTPMRPSSGVGSSASTVREVALRAPVVVCPCLMLNSRQWRGTRVVGRGREQWHRRRQNTCCTALESQSPDHPPG
jgi:hypothetical protein